VQVILMRRLAPVVMSVMLAIPALPAGAQTQPASTDSTGFIGIPEYTSAETGIPFFYALSARSVDENFRKMRDAIAKCDRKAYDEARGNLSGLAAEPGAVRGSDKVALARFDKDYSNVHKSRDQAPPFPEPCPPPKNGTGASTGFNALPMAPMHLYLIGGGFFSFGGTGSVTGVDTFFGDGRFLISDQAGGMSQAAGMAGARVRVNATWFDKTVDYLERDRQARQNNIFNSAHFFFETGIQSSFGAQSFIQPFQTISGTPQAFGSSTVNENLQIPILIGAALPLVAPQASTSPVFLDVYGGITLDSWNQTLQGREAGAPAGPGFFGQQNRFTVDPTVGLGVRTQWGPVILGLSSEVQFRPGGVVTAGSPNFPSETYYGTVDPHANVVVMGRIGIPLGGR